MIFACFKFSLKFERKAATQGGSFRWQTMEQNTRKEVWILEEQIMSSCLYQIYFCGKWSKPWPNIWEKISKQFRNLYWEFVAKVSVSRLNNYSFKNFFKNIFKYALRQITSSSGSCKLQIRCYLYKVTLLPDNLKYQLQL